MDELRLPLRIGVLVNGPEIHGWEYAILGALATDPRYTIAVSIENGLRPDYRSKFRLKRDWGNLPWRLLDRLDSAVARRKYSGRSEYDADDTVPLKELFPSPPHVLVTPQTSPSGLVHRFGPADLETLRAYDLDVIIRFGFNILRGEVLHSARHGVWSFHHADHRVNRGMPAGFWEVEQGEPFTGTILQVLSEDLDNGSVLRASSYVTMRSSWNENRRRIYTKSTTMLLDALSELADSGRVVPRAHDIRPFRLYDRPLYTAPRPPAVAKATARMLGNKIGWKLREGLNVEEWRVLVGPGDVRDQSIRKFRELVPPAGTYWADPFVVDFAGVSQLYFEDFDIAAGKGRISTGRLTPDGIVDVRVALEPEYHLSYPFMQVHDGRLFMVPESYQSGNVELWECIEFPHDWTKRRNLLEGVSAVDSTLLRRDGRWWLFSGLDRVGYGDHGDELHVFLTDDLLHGTLTPHPANPIVTDARTARMGGPFVTMADRTLLRMSQLGGERYGGGLQVMRVDELTDETYRETLVESVGPNWRRDVEGTHHLCIGSTYSAIDACVAVPKRQLLRRRKVVLERQAPPKHVGRSATVVARTSPN